MPPKVTYEVPAEQEIVKVQVVAGYGNVDVVMTVIDHGKVGDDEEGLYIEESHA
jgi:hypothetical protein